MAARVKSDRAHIKESRDHRDPVKNPRRYPEGPEYYDSPSRRKLWRMLDAKEHALLSGPEMRFLQDVPRLLGSGDYANLGHALGGSAILLADGLDEYGYSGLVYSVDLFPRKNDYKKALHLLNRYGYKNQIVLCKGSTVEWVENLKDKRFKFIFVDADHSYQGVKTDLYNWMFLLEKGGLISLHDTNQSYSHRAIQEVLVGKWKEEKHLHIHRIRTFRKPL